MKKVLMLLVLLLSLFSCKTTKHATAEMQTAVMEQKNISEQVTESKQDNSVIEIAENENIIITNFSLPDSSGRQHIITITKIQRHKATANKINIVSEQETVKTDQTQTTANIQAKVLEASKTETKTPMWVIVGIVVLGIGILVIVYLILKRYKIL